MKASDRLKSTSFYKLHRILESRPQDSAMRVDREILEGVMRELIAAADKLEKVQNAARELAPSVDFTSDESPQDTVLSLLKECRDAVIVASHGIGITVNRSAELKALAERVSGLIGEDS